MDPHSSAGCPSGLTDYRDIDRPRCRWKKLPKRSRAAMAEERLAGLDASMSAAGENRSHATCLP
jgi:hypothetical protein